jgi:hypothetical protein
MAAIAILCTLGSYGGASRLANPNTGLGLIVPAAPSLFAAWTWSSAQHLNLVSTVKTMEKLLIDISKQEIRTLLE